ncbi:hypothetical protein [Phormidium tenue]|uniref:hypothetical protein n=1 Tax=Phormidium tenue TaxID=126344 RepID=UPI0011151BDA|nr:hypothetical protein [Phormidium tenue]MBD2232425.1 hypothetical protein [Phormidium tenue FACHB-1052]
MKASTSLPQPPYSPLNPVSQQTPQPTWAREWLWQRLKTLFAAIAGSTAPQIRLLRDKPLSWRAYDPVSRQTTYFTGEDELRQWLEQRYYR